MSRTVAEELTARRTASIVERRPSQGSPIGEALAWVSRITTVGLMMVLPALGGNWLDGRLGTRYWIVVGLIAGVTIGLWQVLQIAGSGPGRRRNATPNRRPNDDSNSATPPTDSTEG
jgi:hypothetical protein